MKITLLPSALSVSGSNLSQYLTTFLVNGRVAIDAGSLGFFGTPEEQAAVRHVFLSHTHIDHWASLPTFLINVAGMAESPPTVYGSDVVLDSLRRDVFNGRVWPNFLGMGTNPPRFLNVQEITGGQTIEVAGLRITPVPVNHSVPTLGFLIEEATSAVVIASDTSATEEIWQRASGLPNLKAVFLEATLPNEMTALAGVTRHLTSMGFVGEMAKLPGPVRFLAVHLSARAREQVVAELLEQGLPNVEIALAGKTYEF